MLVRTRSDAQLRAEVLALRHQLRVLERKAGKPQNRPQRSARRFTPRVRLGRLIELTEMGLLHTRIMGRDHGDWVGADVGAAGNEAIIRDRITGDEPFLNATGCEQLAGAVHQAVNEGPGQVSRA